MQPDDGGTEQQPVPARPRGRLLLPLVVAGAALIVVATAFEGRPTFTPPQLGGTGGIMQAPGAPPTEPPSPRPPAVPTPPPTSGIAQTVLLVLAALVAVVVLVVLIRLLVRALRKRKRRSGLRGLAGLDAIDDQRVADAPTVLRGIAAALVALETDREPGDAVVRAWLGLQQAAEDAGLPRAAAETPTEFTGRVLSRTGADRSALDALLRLYLRARFGDGAISPADAASARDALRALETSWERVAAADRA
ncbi:DUF4129 domain-containing protein [Amnibacterium endophyticum]|uniref:DUF4129 domain-containing protein n=1 Tax=Amnibacterium endophyticum TaxID=2109337 RepID=A0ABW4L9X9_9MICO